jgi:pimeloyl-ACP methyl ester carboxylesterase
MAIFDGADGTRLAYHQAGEGRPLICVPGGPMQASAYLGDLGGLSAHRWLVLLGPARNRRIRHPGGPGDLPVRSAGRRHRSAARPPRAGPNRPVGTLRRCGAGPAVHHPAPRPRRPSRADQFQPAGEAWFPDAFAALERIWSGDATAADWTAIAPFTYGRWDAVSQAHRAQEASQTNADAAAIYYSTGALDPEATSASLARLRAPVLLVAGEYDAALPPKCAAEYAGLFGQAELAVQPGGGHFPWLDDPEWLVQTLAGFLR